jgi:stage II sporulation protein D
VLAGLFAVPSADAASKFTIRGAGYGHGVGMSQYGAYGYALHGWTYDDILAHYYTDTTLSDAPSTTVRVLLQPSIASAAISGATSVNGARLKPGQTYYAKHGRGSTAVLVNSRGKRMASGAMIRVRGTILGVGGLGKYRGAMEYRPSGTFGVQGVNALDMENYVRGVIARESFASWPAEALKAQAVAARTYALTTTKAGDGFDQYPDTRSQVYGGVAAETETTDAATDDTAGQVVTYDGEPVTTYFFSTSGGETENVENTALGDAPLPWLKGVKDPYDGESPKHRWTVNTSTGSVGAQLGSLVKGSFKGIEVTRRGVSPRIVTADIIGSGGRTAVDGATIRARLGLYDDWAYFTSISTKAPPTNQAPKAETDRLTAGRYRLHGTAIGDAGRKIVVQHRQGTRWVRAGATRTDRRGNYWFVAKAPGAYRIRFGIEYGPVVHVG